jgi:uncharacterized membrane protein
MIVIVEDKSDTVSLCGLTWPQIFILTSTLMDASEETNRPEVRKVINNILTGCVAATQVILPTIGSSGADGK